MNLSIFVILLAIGSLLEKAAGTLLYQSTDSVKDTTSLLLKMDSGSFLFLYTIAGPGTDQYLKISILGADFSVTSSKTFANPGDIIRVKSADFLANGDLLIAVTNAGPSPTQNWLYMISGPLYNTMMTAADLGEPNFETHKLRVVGTNAALVGRYTNTQRGKIYQITVVGNTLSPALITTTPIVGTTDECYNDVISMSSGDFVIVGYYKDGGAAKPLVVTLSSTFVWKSSDTFSVTTSGVDYYADTVLEKAAKVVITGHKLPNTTCIWYVDVSSSPAATFTKEFDLSAPFIPSHALLYPNDVIGIVESSGTSSQIELVSLTDNTIIYSMPFPSDYIVLDVVSNSTISGIVYVYGKNANSGLAFAGSFGCPIGFQMADSGIQCEVCPTGSYNNALISGKCTLCSAGMYQDKTTQASCTNCPIGKYQNLPGKASCDACPAGQVQSSTGKTSCDACPAGQVQSLAGKTSCDPCPAGQVQSSTGKTSCDPCPTGSYQSSTGKTSCDLCPIGKYQDFTGKASCNSCPAGKYQSHTGQSSCSSCLMGTYAPVVESTSCLTCQLGEYQNIEEQSSCKKCSAGSFAGTTGSFVCSICPAGSYSELPGQSKCTPCSVNTYQPYAGTSGCWSCPVGFVQPSTGQDTCINLCVPGQVYVPLSPAPNHCEYCPQGTYESEGECVPCPVGTHQHIVGSTQCIPCDLGQYADEIGQAWCKPCNTGTYQDEAGSIVCKACGVAQYQDILGSISCKSCPIGTYQNITSQTICQPCNLGQYNDLIGQTACKSCPVGSYAGLTGQVVCTNCTTGHYQNLTGQSSCFVCPDGLFQDAEGKTACRRCRGGFIDTDPLIEPANCAFCPQRTIQIDETCVYCEDCVYPHPLEAKNELVFALLGLVLVSFTLMEFIALYTDQHTLDKTVVSCIKERLGPSKAQGKGFLDEIFSLICYIKKKGYVDVERMEPVPSAYEIPESAKHINETSPSNADREFLEYCTTYKEIEEKSGKDAAEDYVNNTLKNNAIVARATQAYLDDDIIRGPVTFLKLMKHFHNYVSMLVKSDIDNPRSIKVLLGFVSLIGDIFITGCFYYNLDNEDIIDDYYNLAGKVIPYGIYSALCMVVLKILIALFVIKRYSTEDKTAMEMMIYAQIVPIIRTIGLFITFAWIVGCTAGVIVFALNMSDTAGSNWMKAFGAAALTDLIVFPILKILLIIGFGSYMVNVVKNKEKTLGCCLYACLINFGITYF